MFIQTKPRAPEFQTFFENGCAEGALECGSLP
jgi:hypothetical protein